MKGSIIRKIGFPLGLLLTVGISLSAQASNAADHNFADVTTLGPNPVTVGNAQLVRNDNGVTCVIHTSGLIAGDVYSVWWIMLDEGLVYNAAGGIAGDDGTATFAGHASTGPVGPEDGSVVLSGGSFDNPRGDTVVLIIRHHGPPVPGHIDEQMGTFGGQCSAPGANCKNIQKAVFVP